MIERLSILLIASLLAVSTASADVIGVYRDWTAVTSTKNKQKTCMMWSQPKKSEGHEGKRGEVFAFVTHQPADKRVDRVSFEAGYPLEGSPRLKVSVGEDQFTLRVSGTAAWTRNKRDDADLIEAMRAGTVMTVEGRGPDGATVRDRYSLMGFTAAYNAISKACDVR